MWSWPQPEGQVLGVETHILSIPWEFHSFFCMSHWDSGTIFKLSSFWSVFNSLLQLMLQSSTPLCSRFKAFNFWKNKRREQFSCLKRGQISQMFSELCHLLLSDWLECDLKERYNGAVWKWGWKHLVLLEGVQLWSAVHNQSPLGIVRMNCRLFEHPLFIQPWLGLSGAETVSEGINMGHYAFCSIRVRYLLLTEPIPYHWTTTLSGACFAIIFMLQVQPCADCVVATSRNLCLHLISSLIWLPRNGTTVIVDQISFGWLDGEDNQFSRPILRCDPEAFT